MEFALVVIPLLWIVFGVITYGYMLSFRQAISQGAAEGARSAAVWSTSYDSSQDTARHEAAVASIDEALGSYGVGCGDGATCEVTFVDCDEGTCAEVTVSYPYGTSPLTPKIPLIPLPSDLTYTASVRAS